MNEYRGICMGWIIIIIALAYAPIIYKINSRITSLEEKIVELEDEIKQSNLKKY